jgi:pimeloyl-ACP methyl ester carboxylesterase
MSVATFLGAHGLKLAADVEGDGARGTVMLAHGGGQTRHSWASTAKRLAALGWRTVCLDLRGHGDSD